MKLGIQSAILDGMSFEEVIDFAAENNFKCVVISRISKGRQNYKLLN